MDHDVRRFLSETPKALRPTVEALRRLVLAAAPDTRETVVWRSLSYHRPELGGRVKGAVCLITPKADHVELGFIHGALLPDPSRLLTGDGVSKRTVALDATPTAAELVALASLIRAAFITRPTIADPCRKMSRVHLPARRRK